jgi:preprotein translocase subunit SecE
MSKIRLFIEETYTELTTKVSWPTWSELQESAIVVMAASLIIGVVVYLIDLAFSGALSVIYSM